MLEICVGTRYRLVLLWRCKVVATALDDVVVLVVAVTTTTTTVEQFRLCWPWWYQTRFLFASSPASVRPKFPCPPRVFSGEDPRVAMVVVVVVVTT